ncbi:hypothetical protein CPJCM30710_17320 [Clostridium polyendosporum]|uniref:DUF218 domain-containing protein n=1 Tax=Clostridium polyendosporum TaxID=69208 RepID=A0A919S0I6_9CLOT|nr:YdcF family protein [Clostridium polyendosporum]GIM29066.1 hypothetical protein CPJCM30710_17320 [Clostridium polyendosporum]
MKKRMFMFLGIIIALVVVLEMFIFSLPMISRPKKADVIIILGCKLSKGSPGLFLQKRIEKGMELFKQGYGRYIIVSGGKEKGEKISEAESMYRVLIKYGINEDSIILEDKSQNTSANIKNCTEIMRDRQFNSSIIVSNFFHLRRVWILAKRNNIDATYDGIFIWRYFWKEIQGSIREIPAIIKDSIYR